MYCVYFHINPLKNQVFYVGQGLDKGVKRSRPWSRNGRSEFWRRTVAKYGLVVDVVHRGLTQDEAFEWEKFYIKRFGRRDIGTGNLVNHSEGGEHGGAGSIRSAETKAKMSAVHKARGHITSKFFTGRKKGPWTPEQRAKLEGIKKAAWTPERRAKMVEVHKATWARRKAKLTGSDD